MNTKVTIKRIIYRCKTFVGKCFYKLIEKNELKYLSNEGIMYFSPVIESKWEFRRGKRKKFKCFYSAYDSNKNKLFVKGSNDKKTINEEYNWYVKLKNNGFSNFLLNDTKLIKGRNFHFLVSPFVDNISSFYFSDYIDNHLTNDVLSFLDKMEENAFVHGDINGANCLIINNHLKIIDFEHMMIKNQITMYNPFIVDGVPGGGI